MATTEYGTNHGMAVKLWSKRLNAEVLKATWATRFMGTSSASIIQVKDETSKSPGDKITYGLRMQLTQAGIAGDATLQGNEEAMTTYTDAVVINQLRGAVLSSGKMSEQRVPFSVRDEAMAGLRDWWAGRIDTSFFNQLCGYTAQADTKYSGMQAIVAPDSDHILRPASGEAADESISTTSTFTLALIDKAVERARPHPPAIRPVNVDGKNFYVYFMHDYTVTDMKSSTTTGQWTDIQKAAMQGGEIKDNPIFSGALGVYNGAILHADSRVTQGVSGATGLAVTGVKRNVFCGAQAGVMGYGRESGENRYTWVEELFDYGNQLGVSAGLIFGLKKSVFNSIDYATVVTACYGAAH